MVLIKTEKCIRVNFQIQVVCIDSSNKTLLKFGTSKKPKKYQIKRANACPCLIFYKFWYRLTLHSNLHELVSFLTFCITCFPKKLISIFMSFA